MYCSRLIAWSGALAARQLTFYNLQVENFVLGNITLHTLLRALRLQPKNYLQRVHARPHCNSTLHNGLSFSSWYWRGLEDEDQMGPNSNPQICTKLR